MDQGKSVIQDWMEDKMRVSRIAGAWLLLLCMFFSWSFASARPIQQARIFLSDKAQMKEVLKLNLDIAFAKYGEYIDIITEKSAVLFSACCRLGAFSAGADEKHSKLLSDFGMNVGVAFQIADDLLDITGDESKTGKTLGSDIYKNKPTLSVIHLLKTIDGAQRNSLIERLNTDREDKKELAKLLDRYGSFKYARRCAEGYIAKAKELLAGLKESDARNALTETAQFAVSRAN
jgi:octaprenyl-diphosphate synthase